MGKVEENMSQGNIRFEKFNTMKFIHKVKKKHVKDYVSH